MKYVLIIYLSTYSAQGGISVTSADFQTLEKCQIAAEYVVNNFKTFMTQKPKVVCLEK